MRSPDGESVSIQLTIDLLHETRISRLAPQRPQLELGRLRHICLLVIFTMGLAGSAESHLLAAATGPTAADRPEITKSPASTGRTVAPPNVESADDWNRRLRERFASIDPTPSYDPQEYVIGPEDVLDINVFEAPEMNRGVRVSASGEISLPLLGGVTAAGLTPRELETTLEELLRQKYMRDPHVSVFVREMQSHPVSVVGAVRKPGIFQIRGSKTLLEILSLAEGLADDAGETVIVLRHAGEKNAPQVAFAKANGGAEASPAMVFQDADAAGAIGMDGKKLGAISKSVAQVNLKDLLDSTDPGSNPVVYPGDIVKVARAGIVYVVGAVGRPGGFAMKGNEKISVLQAIALSEGLTRTAAKGSARIIRTNEQSGARTETPVDLGNILSGKSPDPMLGARDVLFVPDSAAKTTFSRSVEVAVQTLTGLLIFHW